MITAIIQARYNSTRLPGKVLADICDKPMLEHIIDRVKASELIEQIIVATSDQPDDKKIIEHAKFCNVNVYSGNAENVLDRFYQASKLLSATIIVRITADDPFKDPEIIDKVLYHLIENDHLDYVSNNIEPSFPEGLDVEAFRFSALKKAWKEALLPSEREHVTPYIYKNNKIFNVANIKCDCDLSDMRWTVDYINDLNFAREIYKKLYGQNIFYMRDILNLLHNYPELLKLNKGIKRNEGYLRSIKNDNVPTS